MRRDTRTWHSWPGHNSAGYTRYAVVNRWAPWWLSVAEFGELLLPQRLLPALQELRLSRSDHSQWVVWLGRPRPRE